jgi:hypothetical protein
VIVFSVGGVCHSRPFGCRACAVPVPWLVDGGRAPAAAVRGGR